MAFCATIGMIGNPELDYMSWAWNWGLTYDLPNETWVIEHRHQKFPKPLIQRRHRRDLYNRLEIAIDKCVCSKQFGESIGKTIADKCNHSQCQTKLKYLSF